MAAVGVIGAGTMGAGVAQVAAQGGWTVLLSDVSEDVVRKSIDGIRKNLDRLVEKNKLASDARDACSSRIHAAGGPGDFAGCELVVEAVVEDLAVKAHVLRPIAAASPRAIIASNTSSLSITKIGRGIDAGKRTVGMHFFNPVPLMPLVEVIAGDESDSTLVQRVYEIAVAWGKTAVRAKDTPGFIVNRVARGYYLESVRMLEEGVAGIDEIDHVLRTLGGFRMGPFELMDLIGIDVNYAVTCSVWEQLGKPARLAPHELQRKLVEGKMFGRKSKLGFYSYQTEHPVPAVLVNRRSFELPQPMFDAVRRFCEKGAAAAGSITEQYVFARVLAAVINEAAIALDEGVASAGDIDIAMKKGTNYPKGPLEWADQIGRHTVAGLLRILNASVTDGRFAPSHGLA